MRIVLNIVGSVSVGIGAVGIVVPVLPTTPFLLLAAACFVRSSPRLHTWLLGHRRLGPYVAGFVDGTGMPARAKRVSLVALWLAIGVSAAIVVITAGWSPVSMATVAVLLVVAVLVTRYILTRATIAEETTLPEERAGAPGPPAGVPEDRGP